MKQIIIPVRNETGVLANVSQLLGQAGINIETIDAEAVTNDGVIILTVDHYDRVLRVLRDGGYDAISEDALVLKLPNHPGALAQIAQRMKEAGLSIRSLRIVQRVNEESLVTLVVQDPEKAKQVLDDVIVPSVPA